MKINGFVQSVILVAFCLGTTCGSSFSERILNGQEVILNYDYTARILTNGTAAPQLGCGVFLTYRHILTVGTLVAGYSNWTIGYGNTSVPALRTFVSNVAVLHPQFVVPGDQFQFSEFDLGIIFIPVNVNIDTTIMNPIALPATVVSLPRPNEEGRVVGFGATNSSLQPSSTMREVYLTTLNTTRCQLAFSSALYDSFCAIDEYYAGNVCQGDTGSGYVVYHQGRPVLAGITAVVSSGCNPGLISGYVHIQSHIEWIRAFTGL